MLSKIINKVRGFSPVELVIMVGFGALAAAALIFLATSPQYMASQPTDVNVNIKVESASTVSKGAVATAPSTLTRQPSAKAAYGDPKPDLTNIVGEKDDQLITVYPTGTAPVGLDSADRVNIQWAVDNVIEGGTVVLKQYKKGTSTLTSFKLPFFTPADFPLPFIPMDNETTLRIHVLRDVNIQGEYTQREDKGMGVKEGTTVEGGHAVFVVGHFPGKEPVPVSFTLKDVRFLQNYVYGLKIMGLKGNSEISNCSFVGLKWGAGYAAPDGGAWPIVAGGFYDPVISPYSKPSDITGNLNILNNYMGLPDLNSIPASPVPGLPKQLFFSSIGTIIVSTDADIKVDGNYMMGSWQGLIVAFNKGLSTITNNTIIKDGAFIAEGFAVNLGLWPLVPKYAYNGKFVVKSNKIKVRNNLLPSPFPPVPDLANGIYLMDYNESQLDLPPSETVPSGITNVIEDNEVTIVDGGIAALSCNGACRNSTFKNNVLNGNYSMGARVTQETVDYLDLSVPPFTEGPINNSFLNNTFNSENATIQLFVDEFSNKNTFTNNDYDYASLVGAMINGDENKLSNENYVGNYAGKYAEPFPNPIIAFNYEGGTNPFKSENNTVSALKNDQPLTGDDFCDQVWDINLDATGTTTNNINMSCAKVPTEKLALVKAKIKQRFCEMSGGAWSDGACSCPDTKVLNDKGRCACPAGTAVDYKNPQDGCVAQ